MDKNISSFATGITANYT